MSEHKNTMEAYLRQSMKVLDEAHENGYLVYASEYRKNRPELTVEEQIVTNYGFTSHGRMFEHYRGNNGKGLPTLDYRLKAKVSASLALRTLLTSGVTIVDCGAAANMAQIYAVLLKLEKEFGEEFGRLRFDALFGAKESVVPEIQRLLITSNGAISGTKNTELVTSDGNTVHFNPFSFLVNISKTARFDPIYEQVWGQTPKQRREHALKTLKKGSMLGFQGHEDYYRKHPFGENAGYNGIVLSTKEANVRLWVFGSGSLDENQMRAKHVEAYNDKRSLLEQRVCSGGLIPQTDYPPSIKAGQVHGLNWETNVDFTEELENLFTENFSELYKRYIEFIVQNVARLNSQRNYKPLTEVVDFPKDELVSRKPPRELYLKVKINRRDWQPTRSFQQRFPGIEIFPPESTRDHYVIFGPTTVIKQIEQYIQQALRAKGKKQVVDATMTIARAFRMHQASETVGQKNAAYIDKLKLLLARAQNLQTTLSPN